MNTRQEAPLRRRSADIWTVRPGHYWRANEECRAALQSFRSPADLMGCMRERRSEPRVKLESTVQAVIGQRETLLGHCFIHDVSESGACIVVYCPLPLGSSVTISTDEVKLTGSVCSCVPLGSDYRVGLKLSVPPFGTAVADGELQSCPYP